MTIKGIVSDVKEIVKVLKCKCSEERIEYIALGVEKYINGILDEAEKQVKDKNRVIVTENDIYDILEERNVPFLEFLKPKNNE
ncbi:hypothetical protein HERIO_48 [Hepatospora eriocheir]|uniref:Transcription factor CBF/NF-Y/archaeal histone domain-containing protein n=1 Tax=Hepatospora eriocheir TaxID=1081669 RepID=A0A1X0QEF4_9MICR|nr:hypothetical protein HERIO_48 [Hepatospora eriocheir]